MPETGVPNNSPRDAMRAYLQRAEVRLSTMHRIAAAFISGAGLLLLLPLFLKDALASIAKVVAEDLTSLSGKPVLELCLLAVPVVIAFGIPVYAMYLLLRDVILFYFSASIPEPQ